MLAWFYSRSISRARDLNRERERSLPATGGGGGSCVSYLMVGDRTVGTGRVVPSLHVNAWAYYQTTNENPERARSLSGYSPRARAIYCTGESVLTTHAIDEKPPAVPVDIECILPTPQQTAILRTFGSFMYTRAFFLYMPKGTDWGGLSG